MAECEAVALYGFPDALARQQEGKIVAVVRGAKVFIAPSYGADGFGQLRFERTDYIDAHSLPVFDGGPTEEARTISRRKVVLLEEVAAEFLEDAKIDTSLDSMFNEAWVRMRITGFLWGEDVGKQTVSYPANWFEHIKQALGLRYREIHVDVSFKAIYPDFHPPSSVGLASLRAEVRPRLYPRPP